MLAVLPEQVRWIENFARAGAAGRAGWPGEEFSVMGGGAKAWSGWGSCTSIANLPVEGA